MRLDHLLSKKRRRSRGIVLLFDCQRQFSGDDAILGNTRSHLEHEGQALIGLGYCTGDGVGKQVVARFLKSE